jgi:hypothetical protein
MAITYEPIATTTLGSATATVTFSSISGSYTDLVLVTNPLGSAGNYDLGIRLNSDTGNNYSWTSLRFNSDDSASPISDRASNTNYVAMKTNISTTIPFPSIIQIQNYSNSTTNKSLLARSPRGDYAVSAIVGLWRNTSAVTSVSISLFGGGSANLAVNSTFTLYGIASA